MVRALSTGLIMEMNQIRELVQYGLDEFDIKDHVPITFNHRLTRCMGRAHFNRFKREARIELSSPLWDRADSKEQENTIIHETAHIIEYLMYGNSDHGVRWQEIHKKIGGTPSRCHNVDRTGLRRQVERLQFKCECMIHTLTKTLATRRWNKYRAYGICKKCRKFLSPVNNHEHVHS